MSRTGSDRIPFLPYTKEELVKIVKARLEVAREGLETDESIISQDAINFAAMKVANVNGDARRILDITR